MQEHRTDGPVDRLPVRNEDVTNDLVAFLLDRITEDERAVTTMATATDTDTLLISDRPLQTWIRDHLTQEAREMATRVLAECQAKRKIVELHNRPHECSTYDHEGQVDSCSWVLDTDPCSTLRFLTAPYSDHPDYPPEWTPA